MRVFVYGTLKQGLHNHHYLIDQQYLGPATLPDYTLYAVTPWYPGILPAEPGRKSQVDGELYDVDASCVARLDHLEDNGATYLRREVTLTLPDGSHTVAWAYIWHQPITPAMPVIPGHQWPPKGAVPHA